MPWRKHQGRKRHGAPGVEPRRAACASRTPEPRYDPKELTVPDHRTASTAHGKTTSTGLLLMMCTIAHLLGLGDAVIVAAIAAAMVPMDAVPRSGPPEVEAAEE